MKNLLYINFDFKKYKNKASGQIKAFNKLNINTTIVTMENEKSSCIFEVIKYENGEFNIKQKKIISKAYEFKQGDNGFISLFKRLIKTIKINNLFKKEVLNYYYSNDFDYCYIRRIGFFVIFLKSMFKKISKKTKIIYEIPTYPLDKYDSFLINFSQKIEMFIFNLFIKKYITVIPVMLQNDAVLDKKMISIYNSVDYDNYKYIDITKPELKKDFNILIVAHILPWHGYDRLINSIKEYNGKYNVHVDIYSGFNSETIKLQNLVRKYNLESKINFLGQKPINEILENISKYHIAMGSLGYHRRNGKYDTSIKNKEYCAMGLPCVCSSIDLSFPNNYKYIYMVSNDDKYFDIGEIISWYKEIYKYDYKNEMRMYAKDKLNFETNYKKIFDKAR